MTGAAGNGLFNFPDVSWKYVHTVILIYAGQVTTDVSDARGFPIASVPAPPTEVVRAYVAPPEPQKDGRTERMDCVIQIENKWPVTPETLIEVPDQPNIIRSLIGRYKINENGLRPNPLDTRLLCTRPLTPNTTDLSDITPVD